MSHFSCLVILGKSQPHSREVVQDAVSRLIAPYDENGEWFKDGSKWDWWVIGGRWTGALDGYDPETDPRNIETCKLCGGTGDRPDLGPPEWKKECNGCNGCHGKGKSVKWPTKWAENDSDIALLSTVKQDFQPYSVVTPDGKWYDSGSMGWFGAKREETMTEEAWRASWAEIRKQYHDHYAVIVDCHV